MNLHAVVIGAMLIAPEFLPIEGGYAPFMFGHVVDMFQFPMFSWVWPNWIPFVGGQSFTFFELEVVLSILISCF
jgi:hypothetical protein